MTNGRVKVGIIGSQFQAGIHAASLQIMPHEAEVVAIASPTPGNAAALAKRFRIPRVFADYREMLRERDIEMVTIAAPNSLHADMTRDIAAAGKHIVCEKPLAMTIAEWARTFMAKRPRQRTILCAFSNSPMVRSDWWKIAGRAAAGWTTASKFSAKPAALTPISTWAMHCRPTVKTDTATQSKKLPQRKVGRIPFSRNSGITAHRKN